MLKLRVIPCLDVKDGRVVKGVNFVALRDAGDPVEQAALYDAAGADELMLPRHHRQPREPRHHPGRGLAHRGARVPAADRGRRHPLDRGHAPPAAGRHRQVQHQLGRRGAAGRWCARRRRNSAASAWWSRWTPSRPAPGRWEVFTHGGRRPTGIDAIAWCRQVAALGAGEILLTSMDRDGTGEGFDLELLRAVCGAVRLPVIASGGVGTLQHFVEGAAGRRHRAAGGQRVPFRHVHHRAGEGGVGRGRAAGAPAAPGGLTEGAMAKSDDKRKRAKPAKPRRPGRPR